MMQRIVEIRKVPDVIAEGSEFEDQALRYPFYANHDKLDELSELGNAVFAKVHTDTVNPIKVYEEVNEEGQLLAGPELLNRVASLMLAEDRSRPIHLFQSQASQMHKSDIWKLWCCKQEIKEDLEEAYQKVFGTGLDKRKSLLTLKTEVKEAIKAALA